MLLSGVSECSSVLHIDEISSVSLSIETRRTIK